MRPEMSNLDFTICCTVTFFSKKRRTPPNLNNGMYYPHFVIKYPQKIQRIQRRNYVRLMLNIPIEFKLEEEENKVRDNQNVIQTQKKKSAVKDSNKKRQQT